MRGVLAALGGEEHRRLAIRELAATIYGTAEPTVSQRRSVLRAVATLEAQGRVHSGMYDIGTRTDIREYRTPGYRYVTRARMPTPGLKVWLAHGDDDGDLAAAIAEDRRLSGFG